MFLPHVFQLLISFALGHFNIKLFYYLEKLHEHGYFRMKEPHKYRYSGVEKLHEYGYFRTEEPYGYEYPIEKKLDKNIQGRHGFQIFGKLLQAFTNIRAG